jgi:hypothetical protein
MNALMMAKKMKAESVTGIDSNDSDFPESTLNVSFVKSSLQEFAMTNTTIYDVATIFLWNITPFKEWSEFIIALKRVTTKHSVVIVGIHDNAYMTDKSLSVPNLFWEHGYYVVHKKFSGCVNRHILYAHRMN